MKLTSKKMTDLEGSVRSGLHCDVKTERGGTKVTGTNSGTGSDEAKRNKCCLFRSQAQLKAALAGMADALAC